MNKKSITDNRRSINTYWKGEKASIFSLLKKKFSGSFENLTSELLIYSVMWFVALHMVVICLSATIQNILTIAMQNNVTIHSYILNVSGPPSPNSNAKHTTVKSDLKFQVGVITSQFCTRAWLLRLRRGEEANHLLFQKQESFNSAFTVGRGKSLSWKKLWCLMAVFIKTSSPLTYQL